MLFNSYAFLLVFLPATYGLFHALAARNAVAANLALALASLAFYGWWDLRYVPLLAASIACNYGVARRLLALRRAARPTGTTLGLAVGANLALLGYFKYADFFIGTVNALAGTEAGLLHLVLPLGISFFTFTQVALLVDIHRGEVDDLSATDFALFVTYFPHLIAGPVLHHREMMPQFAGAAMHRRDAHLLNVGLAVFAFGLAKKTLLADTIAPYADAVFGAAAAGRALTAAEAWGGALAYTFQLYFDFSGYSDMAIGLSLMFGVRLPQNFASPYKATSIVDFWRRWHMTLSRFLRDYLYIPLGGNRHGPWRRHANLMATMLLGGLWHGAGWTFVAWGALHGAYLIVNHGWRAACTGRPALARLFAGWRARLLTFAAVVVAWVFFRAESFAAAGVMLEAMAGLSSAEAAATATENWRRGALLLALLAACAWWAPNVVELFRHERPALPAGLPAALPAGLPEAAGRLAFRPVWRWWLAAGFLLGAGMLTFHRNSPFLYFQF
ncbi:MAG: MBOAT family protein [Burkholderiales bacterium]|nr:MBOAT family protein [Burkholderiales bacterium]